jgi:oligopeptide transport system permease protein
MPNSLLPFLLRRVASAIPTLLVLATLTFFMLRLAPGGPFDSERAFPAAIQMSIEKHYGLDLPVHEQFTRWLGGALRGDLGESFQYLGQPVGELIVQALPTSLLLGCWALLLSVFLGLPLGAIAAWQRGKAWDAGAMFVAVSGVSLPSYLVASLLVLLFSIHLGWLPPALFDDWRSMVLPIVTLGLRPMAMIARLTRASMIESLTSDYIRTAHGKGLSEPVVVFKHALRNSLIPVITLLGPIAANLVTGSFLIEMVFQIPGLGKYFVSAIINRDYPLVMGVTLVYGSILIVANLAVDALSGLADPRIRLEKAG